MMVGKTFWTRESHVKNLIIGLSMNLSPISPCSVKCGVYPRIAEVACPVTSGNAMHTKFQDGEC
jgi:hypothetical protein